MNLLCPNGHVRDSASTYWRNGRTPVCRVCRRLGMSELREARQTNGRCIQCGIGLHSGSMELCRSHRRAGQAAQNARRLGAKNVSGDAAGGITT